MNNVNIKKFNQQGLDEFKSFLNRIKYEGSDENPPFSLLSDPGYSEILPLSKQVNRIDIDEVFKDRYDLADRLVSSIFVTESDRTLLLDDTLAASWLSLAYFNQICERNNNGKYNCLAINRYILDLEGRQKIYRHLIFSAVATFQLHKNNSKLFLKNKSLHVGGELMEQVATKEWVMLNQALVEVLHRLYWDESAETPKTNCQDHNPVPDGGLRRFVGKGGFADEYRYSYDFWTMTADQIFNLLPEEFNKWKN